MPLPRPPLVRTISVVTEGRQQGSRLDQGKPRLGQGTDGAAVGTAALGQSSAGDGDDGRQGTTAGARGGVGMKMNAPSPPPPPPPPPPPLFSFYKAEKGSRRATGLILL